MNFSRRLHWLLAATCVLMLGPGNQSLFAQNSLPATIIQAQQLSAQDKTTIDGFIDAQVTRLQSSDPEQVALGRSLLAEQFGLGSSPAFINYYSQAIAQRVAPLLVPDGPLMTRLNIAIVSAKLSDASLVTVLKAGADDPSPAVRYWIAKAVGAAAKNDRISQQQQQDVLDVMAARLKVEDSELVLGQVMLAISEIDLDEAIEKVLEGLDARVSFYKQHAQARFKPVHDGTQQLWSKLIALRSDGKNVDKEQKELARIAFKYYALIAEQMAAGIDNPDEDETAAIKQDKATMAGICGRVMDDVARQVARISPPQMVDPNNATELKASADRWRDVLKAPPFNYTDEQLAVGE